jgi:hypothetical protein
MAAALPEMRQSGRSWTSSEEPTRAVPRGNQIAAALLVPELQLAVRGGELSPSLAFPAAA